MPHSTQDPRQSQIEKYLHVLYRATIETQNAIKEGFSPTDLWLGPEQAKTVENEFQHMLDTGQHFNPIIHKYHITRGTIEGQRIMGLKIRLMLADGIQVGISFPKS